MLMVQCDSCDQWFHFDCVGVTGDIENRDWSCERCKLLKESREFECERQLGAASQNDTSVPDKFSYKLSKVSSKVSKLSDRQKAIALSKLQEEQEIKLDILNRKYRILDDTIETEESNYSGERQSSMDYTLKWAKKVQDISNEFAKMSTFDNISISLSDRDREVVNKSSSRQLKDNLATSKATEATRIAKNPNDFLRQAVLTSKVVPGRRQPNYTSLNADQSKLRIESEVERGQMGLQCGDLEDGIRDFQASGRKLDRIGLHGETKAEVIPNIERSLSPLRYSESQQRLLAQLARKNCFKPYEREVNFKFGPRSGQGVHRLSTNFNTGLESTPFHRSTSVDGNFDWNSLNNQHSSTTVSRHDFGNVCNSASSLTRTQIAARHVFKDLPEFHGNAEDWPIFLSAFENSTKECGYTDGENLGRLQKSLKGDAKDLVCSRLLHASSVPGVMDTLNLIFGRPNLIIHQLLDKINKTPSPKADDLSSLIKFAISVQNFCGTIESSGNLEYLQNPILIQTLTDKLPIQIQLNWAYFKFSAGSVDLSIMGKWLYQLAQVATEVVNPSNLKFNVKKDPKDNNNQKSLQSINYTNALSEKSIDVDKSSSSSTRKPFKCHACNSNSYHKLESCKEFKELSTDDRWVLVKKNKICGSCFGDHHYFKCKSKKKCGKDGCSTNHHVLLHNSSRIVEMPVTEVQSTSTANSHRSLLTTAKFPDIFRIVPVILSYNGNSIRIFAYLDDGSNLTSLEENIATKIGAFGTKSSLCVLWALGDNQVESNSRQISVKICGVFDDAEEFSLDHVRTVKKLVLPSQSITQRWLDQYQYFNNVPISTYNNATPQMIIGLQYSKLMVSLDTIEGDWSQPIVCRTRLGWVVQGPNDRSISNDSTPKYGLNMCECQLGDSNLHQLVREFFSIESLGVKVSDVMMESKELIRAKHLLESTIIKQGNRYESALLWRNDNIEFPSSFGMALRRLECVESKLKRNPVLAERMRDYIADFIEKGYIRKLSPIEQRKIGPRTWHLPIFPVFNPKKPDKLRVVWDGAAKVNGQSLNSNLLVEPDLLVPLPDILKRFRQRKIGITGDIKEMFHQILVRESDQDSQRFLWRDGNSSVDPDVYVLNVMTFGSSCSPSIAQFVKNKNAMDFQDKFPRAVEAITKSHYVDDMIESTHTVADAVQLVNEVQHIHHHAGFVLRSFNSNSQEVLMTLNGGSQSGTKILDDKTIFTTERVLGMYWNTGSDTFTYCLKFVKVNLQTDNFAPTKREVLRIVMSIFDPLGFLAHYVVFAKILLQEIWRHKVGWDDALPVTLRNQWILWLEQLTKVERVHIPRLYSMRMSPSPPTSIQLHVFVDASLDAYAAVAYFRIENDSGVDSCLVEAKTRVAPIKPMSVPRLELQGGVLGTRLVGSVVKSHNGLRIDKTIIWCDSRTVLSWISSDLRKYNQFVTFRVAEILDSPDEIEWRWIPSDENVADDATKSKKIADLDTSLRWFTGPKFLRDQDSNWTFELDQPEFETDEELRSLYLLSHLEVPISNFIEFERYSNWQRLVRATAYVLRFVHNVKSEFDDRRFDLFSSDELLLAELLLYKKIQFDSFKEELVIIRFNETAPINMQKYYPQTSFIRTCSAYLDKNGVMRMKGRIDAVTSISDTAKRPIILDRHHYVTQLIVYYYHRKYKHMHHQTVLNEVKQKFWIPKLRVLLGIYDSKQLSEMQEYSICSSNSRNDSVA